MKKIKKINLEINLLLPNVLECGYWGNLSYINHIFTHNNWPNTSDVMIDGIIENVDHCQSQTWVLLQK